MSATSFYIQRPADKHWNVLMDNVIIEASAIDPQDPMLSAFEKTDEYVRDNLKVVAPADFGWPTVKKASWLQCKGPAMKLSGDEHKLLYHQLDPSFPFPKGFIKVRLPMLESTGQAAEIRKKFSINQ